MSFQSLGGCLMTETDPAVRVRGSVRRNDGAPAQRGNVAAGLTGYPAD